MTKWISLVVASLVLGVTGMQLSPANADSSGSETTTAKVTLRGGDTTHPVGPQDPEGSGEDSGGNQGTGSVGALTIDYASNLKFVQGMTTNNVLSATSADSQAYIQVSDRRYTGDGWQLMLTPGALTGQTDSSVISGSGANLQIGATKFLASGQTVSQYPHVTTTATTLLPLGQVAQVGKADEGTGIGTWIFRLNYDSKMPAKLLINSSKVTKRQAYAGQLVWALADSPH